MGLALKHGDVHDFDNDSKQMCYNGLIPPKEGDENKKNFYYFHKGIAKEHGVDVAIIMNYIALMVKRNGTMPEKGSPDYSKSPYWITEHNGIHWMYHSYTDFLGKYPWLSVSTIRRLVAYMRQKELIYIGNFNAKRKLTTYWYTIKDADIRADYGLQQIKETGNAVEVMKEFAQEYYDQMDENRKIEEIAEQNKVSNWTRPVFNLNTPRVQNDPTMNIKREYNKELKRRVSIVIDTGNPEEGEGEFPTGTETGSVPTEPTQVSSDYKDHRYFSSDEWILPEKKDYNFKKNLDHSSAGRDSVAVTPQELPFLELVNHWNNEATDLAHKIKTERTQFPDDPAMWTISAEAASQKMSVHKVDSSGYVSKTVKKILEALVLVSEGKFFTVYPGIRLYDSIPLRFEREDTWSIDNLKKVISGYTRFYTVGIKPIRKSDLQKSFLDWLNPSLKGSKFTDTRSWFWQTANTSQANMTVSLPPKEAFQRFDKGGSLNRLYVQVKNAVNSDRVLKPQDENYLKYNLLLMAKDASTLTHRLTLLYSGMIPDEFFKTIGSGKSYIASFMAFADDKFSNDLKPGHFDVTKTTYQMFKDHLVKKYSTDTTVLYLNPNLKTREDLARDRWYKYSRKTGIETPQSIGSHEWSYYSKEDEIFMAQNPAHLKWWE